METPEEFCEKINKEWGEVWSNDYIELPKKILEYAKYYHEQMIKNKIILTPEDIDIETIEEFKKLEVIKIEDVTYIRQDKCLSLMKGFTKEQLKKNIK